MIITRMISETPTLMFATDCISFHRSAMVNAVMVSLLDVAYGSTSETSMASDPMIVRARGPANDFLFILLLNSCSRLMIDRLLLFWHFEGQR